jgi:hypothetical protein
VGFGASWRNASDRTGLGGGDVRHNSIAHPSARAALRASGLGRENGAEAIEGYLQSKSVWINNGAGGGNPFIMKPAG